ncbi:MAG: hypothetical protein VX000_13440 [Myxococcota bacterium]|nr:hypothetical protein [Myxococcota bacterium]
MNGVILAAFLAVGSPVAHGAPPGSAELDFRWSTFPDEATQGRMIYLDILGTPVPPVELVDSEGRRFKLNLKVSAKPQTDEVLIQPFLFAIEETRSGEKVVPVGSTEVRTTSGSRASVRFGTDGRTPPRRGIELDFRPKLDAGPRIPAPPADPAQAPAPETATEPPAPDLDDEFLEGPGGAGSR